MIYEKKNGKYVNYKNEEFNGEIIRDLIVGDKVRQIRKEDGKQVEIEVTNKENINGFVVVHSVEREV